MEVPKRPLAVDLFCGVGGMSLGFEQAGFNVAAAVDCESRHANTHHINFPKCNSFEGDLSSLSGDDIRQKAKICGKHIDVLFGGPPCQGFSLIGKRRSDDPRNLRLHDFARLVRQLSPSYFVVENVAGLLLGESPVILQGFIRRVNRAGYRVVKPLQVLDASLFGVPQRRKRVFVLGYRTGLPAPAYPDPMAACLTKLPTVWDAIGDLPRIGNLDYLLVGDVLREELGQASEYAKILRGDVRDPHDRSYHREKLVDGLSGCARTQHTDETVRRFAATEQGTSEPVSRLYRLSKNGLSPTIRAGTGPENGSFMSPRPIHPIEARCITVREAARLHSYPDWFQFHATKWHAFRQIGNSVPPLLARAVAESVMKAIMYGKT